MMAENPVETGSLASPSAHSMATFGGKRGPLESARIVGGRRHKRARVKQDVKGVLLRQLSAERDAEQRHRETQRVNHEALRLLQELRELKS